MTEVSDSELVTRCRDQHDDAAFGELVRRYQSRVFRLAVSVLGQEFAPDAEDVAQEVFVRAYHGLKTYRSDAAFGTWLYRITFNHASNVKARMRFRAPHLPETALATTASAGVAQDERIDQQREQQLVQACVQELPEVYQSAVRLYYWLGASVTEIATLLLHRTMPAPPELSSSFSQDVQRRVKPRRLTSAGRVMMASYTIASLAVLVWFMRDLPMPLILGSLITSGLVGGGTSLYAAQLSRRLHSHPAP